VPATRTERLRERLAARLGDATVLIQPYREGVDSWVDLVTREGAAIAVVRSSKVERRPTRYEGVVDYGGVLQKEVAVASMLHSAGVPTPRVITWERSAAVDSEPSWMLVEYVAHQPVEQLSNECQRQLGTIARRIHAIEPDGDDRTAFEPINCWPDWIRQRILSRVAAAARYMPVPDAADLEPHLRAALAGRPTAPKALLHLDLREPNLAIEGNTIVSVFDLANAIVGDPYLELARLRGCGLLTRAFLEGYGCDAAIEGDRSLDAYELDLSALLVVVSREEIDDDALHRRMIERTTTLLERVFSEEG